jgi:hypothetical protein
MLTAMPLAAKTDSSWMTPQLEGLLRRLFLNNVTGRDTNPRELQQSLRPSNTRLVLGICLLLPIITAPLGIHFLFSHLRVEGRRKERADALLPILKARVRMAWPVMINSAFLRGEVAAAPGLFLAVADNGPEVDLNVMLPIIERMCAAKAESGDETDRYLASIMADTEFTPDRRRVIPDQLTGGRAICAFDVPLMREWFFSDLKEPQWIACLVEPGPQGKIYVIPQAVLVKGMQMVKVSKIMTD